MRWLELRQDVQSVCKWQILWEEQAGLLGKARASMKKLPAGMNKQRWFGKP